MLGSNWGCTARERATRFACDDLVDLPTLIAFRGVSVRAPRAVVWPWVAQIRVAPYSYDWIDNGGRRSPRTLVGLDEPRVGEPFTAVAGRPVGRVVDVDHEHSLTGRIGSVFMTYRLDRTSAYDTRLLLKLVARAGRIASPALCLGDLVMARKQLLTLKELAELDFQSHAGSR